MYSPAGAATSSTMPYTINHKPCRRIHGSAVLLLKHPHMQKHLLTAKHQRDVIGCENVEVVAHYKYAYNNL